MVKTITVKMYFWLTTLIKQKFVHQEGFLYKIVQGFTESNSKGRKTIDLTGGMALLWHSLPSTKKFGVKPISPLNSTL